MDQIAADLRVVQHEIVKAATESTTEREMERQQAVISLRMPSARRPRDVAATHIARERVGQALRGRHSAVRRLDLRQ